MASSYAALVSLQTLIHTIQNHPNPPIFLDNNQVEALLQKLSFLQEFLELHSHLDEYPTQDLESLITDAAYAAQDAIESFIVDRIEESISLHIEEDNQVRCFDLHDAVEKMDIIKKKAMEFKKKPGVDNSQPVNSMSAPLSVSCSPSPGQKSIMVGFDKFLEEILHRLTRDQSSQCQIIPIVGMGGIGKTTLAAKTYEHGLVKHHFDIRVWVTISQNYITREILLEILGQRSQEKKSAVVDESLPQIGERIYKNFSGRRYLVVLDDMWSIEALTMIRRFFPDNRNGSRMVITTRISNVAAQLSSSSSIQLNLLDEDESWGLFCKIVFGEDVCPVELEESGKTIARNCKGLPLSIVVIGGFLSKSKQTKQHWEYVARNLSSIVNLEDNERCLKILYLSYNQLPIHLKPCFLYMGLYPEDQRIRVSYVVKLFVAEGFLKPIDDKLMEVVAEKYIQDLVDRNLLLVDQCGSTGSIKFCKIHDLFRDLCIREAQKENFFYLIEEHNLGIQGDISTQRRIAFGRMISGYKDCALEARRKLQSASLARTLNWEFESCFPFSNFKLLWILDARHTNLTKYKSNCTAISRLYNSRFLGFGSLGHNLTKVLSSKYSLFWNLQTLIIRPSNCTIYGAAQIWMMPHLRHVKVHSLEFDSPMPSHKFVTGNLQTLCNVSEFQCSKEMVERLHNIQKLAINIMFKHSKFCSNYCLKNLQHLQKLERLKCTISDMWVDKSILLQNVTLPHSLKKLALSSRRLRWKDVAQMIGSLPFLEKLKLWYTSGFEWKPTTGQFQCLKFLGMYHCEDLEHWTADSSHFPVLEGLILWELRKLAEIPSGIGEIPTLQLIEVKFCSNSAIVSAKTIAEEQDALGNSELQIRMSAFAQRGSQLASLASVSPNFQVKEF